MQKLIGEKKQFAIQFEVVDVINRFVYGHICYWINEMRIGDFTSTTILSDDFRISFGFRIDSNGGRICDVVEKSITRFLLNRRSKTMDCINTICLYIKKYLTDVQFEDIFYDYIENFQNSLQEDMYLKILSTNFSSKQERVSLETELRNYVLENHGLVYENINDAYVERIIDSNKEDIVAEILKNKYQKREAVDIDCSMINTRSEFIDAIKRALQYPHFCGNNWDAIEDLIYDIILPQKLILHNWREVEKNFPKDAAALKSILEKYSNGRCMVMYI